MISHVIRTCFPVAAQAVANKADEINKLNVFPVPDGDTGTNMSLTLQTVVKEVEDLPQDASMEDIAHAITHGSLMGARGNSGVITSQILRGISEGLVGATDEALSVEDIAKALRNGVKVAFKAVRKPVEGTILTVLKDVSLCADKLEQKHATKQELLDAIVVEAYESVARTPDLLPVLKENGVVDSGAFGFATFIEAFVNAYNGKDQQLTNFKTTVDAHDAQDTKDAKAHVSNAVDIAVNEDWEGSQYRYCTEFLFHADLEDFNPETHLKFLASQGDCELLVGSYPDYKIHVHTNRPDYVLRHMLHRGQIYNVFVHNMDLEAHERTDAIRDDKVLVHGDDFVAGSAASTSASSPASNAPLKDVGFVAVAAGSGQAEILTSLGVDQIISGGQTMNPSTADILKAIEATHARQVVVLPNNSNIRMAAEAAVQAVTTCVAKVVPTKSVLQAFSCMFCVDLSKDFDELVSQMTDQLSLIRDGEITRAVRDSSASDGTPIHVGDVMGIACGSIDVVGHDVCSVTLEVIARMMAEEESDTLTILAGKDMDQASYDNLVEKIEDKFPSLDVDPQRGEQPLYPVIFSLE